ncbi:MAG: T9SS type B sorting domain-containing protein [Bacteroidia bacterium]
MKNNVFIFFLLFCAGSLLAQPTSIDAGPYRKVCPDSTVKLGGTPTSTGGTPPVTYDWQPTTGLTSPTAANPYATVHSTTTYTVKATDGDGKFAIDTVTIFVYPYSVNAGADQTIQQGQTITLQGHVSSGYTSFYWGSNPQCGMYNTNTFTPDAFPQATTVVTLVGLFPHGCTIYDDMTIHVIPGNNLYFYNTFTPNGDGSNDHFYIGNIEKFPDNVLEIYNRYGQKVYNKTGYQNDWDGKYLNEELPAGTYFYVLDPKSPLVAGKYKGSVTIVR